jgi:hypothetical protein
MPILPQLVAGVDDSARRFAALISSFPIPTDEESGRFYHITTALSRTALKNYDLLRRAFEDDAQDYLAWACRNLLEVAVFMHCVLASRAKADEFASHRWIDGIEVVERLKKLDFLLNPNLTASAFDAVLSDFGQKMSADGVVRTAHLVTRDWARDAGLIQEFDCINKVCSKFVHPTVWSILTEDIGSARFPDARDVFYGFGAKYLMEIYVLFKEHVKAYGLRHGPVQSLQGLWEADTEL